MDSFSINVLDSKKQQIGKQTISMSYDKIDEHVISFNDKNGTPLICINTNGNLIFDNSNGDFNSISTDRIINLKISNVKMDYEDNITFSVDGTKTTYKINGNTLLSKNGSTFEPLVKFEEPLDITLPSTIFDDIENDKIAVNGFPFQMFSAFSEEDKNKLGISTFESENKLLHLVKYNNQLYVGRGSKLIPVNIEKQNYYKMGDNSVLGFTIGKLNGISGKQSSGIAFHMSEKELEQVASFINENNAVVYKTEEDFKNNDIDYIKINKQSDLTKRVKDAKQNDDGNLENKTPHIDVNISDKFDDDKSEVDKKTMKDEKSEVDKKTTKDDKAEVDKNTIKENDKKQIKNEEKTDNSKQPTATETATLDIAKLSSVFAGLMAILLISGAWVSVLAFAIFAVLAFTAITSTGVYTFKYKKFNKTKRSKLEKLNHKLAKKEYALDRLENKNKALLGEARKALLKKSINTLNQKITKEKNKTTKTKTSKTHDKTTHNKPAKEQKDTINLDVLENETKSDIPPIEINQDAEIIHTADEKQNLPTSITPEVMLDTSKKLNDLLSNTISYPPEKSEDYENFVNDINSTISSVCKDGVNLDSVPEEEQALFQEYINYRTAYIARNSAKESLDQAKIDGENDLSELEKQYKETKNALNEQINKLYDVSKNYASERTFVEEDTHNNEVSKEL